MLRAAILLIAVIVSAESYAAIGSVVVTTGCSLSVTNGGCLSAVPYAGFNTWYAQNLSVSQTYYQAVSDFLVSSGLQAAWGGTVTAGVDEGWPALTGSTVNRSGGNPVPSGNFTSMPTLTAHAKSNGQIPLLYRDGGQIGCQSEDWGAGTLSSDMTYFNQTWGFQGIKLDGCSITGVLSGRDIYTAANQTLVGLGKPYIVMYGYSNGPYSGYTQAWAYLQRAGTSARNTPDVGAIAYCNTTFINNVMANFWGISHHPGVVGPYHYLDADYLMAQDGTGTLTTDEAVSQIVLAAMFSSPWVIGCDPRPSGSGGLGAGLGTTELATLKNADLISILHDPWVVGVKRTAGQTGGGGFGTANTWEAWCKRLSGTGRRALAIVNENTLGVGAQTITADPSLCGLDTTQTYDFKNVLTGSTTTGHTGTFSTGSVNAHATGVFLITNATENNVNCSATNPGGTGQSAPGLPGGCAFATDSASSNPAGGFGPDGTPISTATAINTAADPGSTPQQGCYQKQRKGVISTDDANEGGVEYLLDNLVAGASYKVYIDFAEIEGKTAGQRLFNLTVNTGTQSIALLSNYDIFVAAGNAGNKAVVVQTTVTADHGYISLDFEPISPPTGVPAVGCIEAIKQ